MIKKTDGVLQPLETLQVSVERKRKRKRKREREISGERKEQNEAMNVFFVTCEDFTLFPFSFELQMLQSKENYI